MRKVGECVAVVAAADGVSAGHLRKHVVERSKDVHLHVLFTLARTNTTSAL